MGHLEARAKDESSAAALRAQSETTLGVFVGLVTGVVTFAAVRSLAPDLFKNIPSPEAGAAGAASFVGGDSWLFCS